MERFGIELVDTRFSYGVEYGGSLYAHDLDSETKRQHLQLRDREVPAGPGAACTGSAG